MGNTIIGLLVIIVLAIGIGLYFGYQEIMSQASLAPPAIFGG